MSAIKQNTFSGLFPRVPDALLPPGAATIAQNCDFAYGDLRNTKGGFLLYTMVNTPRGIYTDEGVSFYTWTVDVNAVRSPMVADPYNRIYYTGDGAMKVANRLGTSATGGPPAASYKVGVPRPTVAPVLNGGQPTFLDGSSAALAWWCHFESGGVRYQEQTITPTGVSTINYTFTPPTRDPSTPESAVLIFRLVFTFTGDTESSTIYTDNSVSTDQGAYYRITITDLTESMANVRLEQGIPESAKEARAYVYTLVNTYNEESAPSAPETVTTGVGIEVRVTVTLDTLTGYAPAKEIRVYRTGTGTQSTDYFFVTSLSMIGQSPGEFEITDNVGAELLNEALSSLSAYPPDDALRGLMALPNGILCAWKGNEVHFSEAYRPWSWPPEYVKTLPNVVVGGIAHGSGAVITTTGRPYLVSGVSPDAMTMTQINVDQAGVSKWSIASVAGSVVYASHDGLVTVNGASASLTEGSRFFTREVWRARVGGAGLAVMRFSVWDGRLVVFSGSQNFTPFMIRFDEAAGTMTDLPDLLANCAFISQLSDQFYYAYGTGIYQFNGGSAQTAVWQSKEHVLPRPTNFGAGQAVVTGSWSIELTAYLPDGSSVTSVVGVSSGVTNFRLQAGFKADRYKVKLTGSGTFKELRLAKTGRELAQV